MQQLSLYVFLSVFFCKRACNPLETAWVEGEVWGTFPHRLMFPLFQGLLLSPFSFSFLFISFCHDQILGAMMKRRRSYLFYEVSKVLLGHKSYIWLIDFNLLLDAFRSSYTVFSKNGLTLYLCSFHSPSFIRCLGHVWCHGY